MEEYNEDDRAKGELKRIDHLVFVTLKYTRTVDIIRSIIEKFISAIDFKVEDIMNALFEKGDIKRVPPVPLVRLRKLEEMYKDDKEVKDLVDYYVFMKKIYHADYKAKEEYRKNVTLVTADHDINIAKVKEYSEELKKHIEVIEKLRP